jgi:death-on-curing family protein
VRNRSVTVENLAAEAGLDVEELLIRSWDAGFEEIDDPGYVLRADEANRLRKLLGLPSPLQISRPQYWQQALGMDEASVRELLANAGLRMTPTARTLPKGAVRILKQHARGVRLLETPPVVAPEPAVLEKVVPPVEFEWKTVGNVEAQRFLSAEQVESIHWTLAKDLAGDADPIDPAGVRSANLLESAVHRQHTSLGDQVKYPTAVMAAAALLHSLVLNHAFHNGNKRTALVSMLVSLDENGLMLICDENQLFKVVLRLAQHELVPREWSDIADREVIWLADWMEDNSRTIEKGERPIQWRKLKQLLGRFDARCEMPTGVGNRMNITRVVESPRRFGMTRRRRLFVQVKYAGDDGREAMKYTVHQIRKELELDDEHGVDSASFYGDAGRAVGDFIVRYRKTLTRLARL